MSDMPQNTKNNFSFTYSNILHKCITVILALSASLAFPWMLKTHNNQLVYTNSIVSIFTFGIFLYFINKARTKHYQGSCLKWFWPAIIGSMFSFCMVAGAQLDISQNVPFTNIKMWFAIVILAIIFSLLTRYSWDVILRSCKHNMQEEHNISHTSKQNIRFWAITSGVIFLCYFLVFLAVYPGFFVYDALDEVNQVITRDFSTHHPLVHVLMLGGLVQLGYKVTGSYNIGIALYTLLQMLIMSGIFAFCVLKLRNRGLKKWGQALTTLYFGLCPVLVMFSLCSSKDGLFTGMLLILVLLLQDCSENPKLFFSQKWSTILLVLSAIGMMLLRHNGFYAFVVFTPLFVLFMKNNWGKIVACLLIAITLYSACNFALTTILQTDDSENQEILTVPIMQLTRAYIYEGDNLPNEEKEKLYEYIPEQYLIGYNPKVSDNVKYYFNNDNYRHDSSGFWNLWCKWALRYPFTYANAWFMTSYGFWYPDTVIDVYRGNSVFTFTYEDSSYFGYEVEYPGFRDSKIPWLDELYRNMSLEIFQQKIPVISMMFSPGFLFWVFAFLLGYLCYHQKWNTAFPFFLPLLCWLTVILGPTYLTRYVVFLWTLLPVLSLEVYKTTQEETN